jgi:hypothetical protein
VIIDEHGNEIPDIVGETDNEYLLIKCLDLTFHLTGDPENAVYFCWAGSVPIS